MKQQIMPYLARIASSDMLLNIKRTLAELKRKVTHKPHVMDVFLHLSDPYSFLLIQVLPDIASRYNVPIELHIINSVNEEMFPEQKMWANNALTDALRLAKLYNLAMPKTPPNHKQEDYNYIVNQLIESESLPNALTIFNTAFNQYWLNKISSRQDTGLNDINEEPLNIKALSQNEALLKRLGHYMGGMIYYAGEWYWGVDRLDHFEERANTLGLSKRSTPTITYNRTYANFCQNAGLGIAPIQAEPLTLFFSIRSPYSHIGLERAIILAKHYNITLIIKPVLPMVMRGMAVPNSKKMYIFHDTKREAKKFGINYGYVADPLGLGVERCYALYEYAQSKGKSVEFLLAYARAVNALGIRSETDSGLRTILSTCGLSWDEAKPFLTNDTWRKWADRNLKEMYALGLWGVPSFKYQQTTVWGQDRLFAIEDAIIQANNSKAQNIKPEPVKVS